MIKILENNQWWIFSLLYWAAALVILLNFNGTGQEADSINHFLFAKYAPTNLALYFDHWAKPTFTLLASPFAQFGFIGIKVFNIICAFGASYFTFKIAQRLELKLPILAPFFYFIFPISFTTTFSGLTEPLCALVLTTSIYLFQQNKMLSCALLLSFTPFIRSEGLILIGIFGLFFLAQKNWKAIIYLFFGHVLYTAIGFLSGQELLWVFTKIPYAQLSSHYGSGGLFHFAEKLNYLMGIPLLVLFILGWIRILATKQLRSQAHLLLYGLFLAFFIAHSLFWYLEVFNSMGLKRVFAAVTPLMAIIALIGLNSIEKLPQKKLRVGLYSVVLLIIVVFPFTKNPAAIEWNDLNLTEAQENAKEVAQFIEASELNFNRFIYTDPYLSQALEINPFEPTSYQILAPEVLLLLKKEDIIIWDSWHSVVDYGVTEKQLKNLNLIKEIKSKKSTYKIYQVR